MARARGQDGVLRITLGGATLTLGGADAGLDGVQSITASLGEQRTRAVPAAGVVAYEAVGHTTGRLTVSVDADDDTLPVLFMASGRRPACVWRPRGDGKGLPSHAFSAVLTSTLSALRGTVLRFEVGLEVDGPVTDSVQ